MRYDFDDIVVTGCSSVSAAGNGLAPLCDLIREGGTALTAVPAEHSAGRSLLWGRAGAFRAAEFMPPLRARKMDRCSQFAVVASGLALADAGLDLKAQPPERIGIALGCGFGGVANSAEFLGGYFNGGVEGLSPMLFPNTVSNAPASNASIEHGLKGPNVTMVQRFCSAESAFLMACRFIAEGRADVMLTGGADDLMPLMIAGFAATGQLDRYATPFGEGSGILVLERAGHAARRQAPVRARVAHVATVGLVLPGFEADIRQRLVGEPPAGTRISLSGTTVQSPLFTDLPVATPPPLQIEHAIGRSLAMGGTAMGALLSTLDQGQPGLHLASSPEGPFYAIRFEGGPPVKY